MKFFNKKTEKAKKRERKRLRVYLGLIVVTLIAHIVISNTGLLQLSELKTRDYFFQLRYLLNPPPVNDEIIIVAIDEATMSEFGLRWPWDRALHAKLIDALTQAGAKVIMFDVLFTEPSNNESDLVLAEAIKRSGRVVLAENYKVIDTGQYTHEIHQLPIDAMLEGVQSTGIASLFQDADGFVRQTSLIVHDRPSLALSTAHAYQPDITISVDMNDRLPVNFLGTSQTIRTVSYYQAMEPEKFLPDGVFKDKMVLVGFDLATAQDLDVVDHFGYPLLGLDTGPISGLEIHGNILASILSDTWLSEWAYFYQLVLFSLVLLSVAFVLWKFGVWLASLVSIAIGLLYLLVIYLMFDMAGIVLDAFTPAVLLIAFLFVERIYNYAVIDSQKRFVQKAFKHYLSPKIVDQLMEDPDQLNLNGELCETTILFTDLAGFTSISESTEPMELQAILTEYFGEMLDVLMEHDGTLDKFIGDAMMCFFGIPVPDSRHPSLAAKTAVDMQLRLAQLNEEWKKREPDKDISLAMRVGVNTGRVVAGNMGAHGVFNYTIMGDPVNLAARLESANKQYGTSVMMGETTWDLCGHEFETRRMDRIRVKGKDLPVTVYELLAHKDQLDANKAEQVSLYEEAFQLYEVSEFEPAIEKLKQSLAIGKDGPSTVLLFRCDEYLQSPPPQGWGGVYTMKTK